MQDALFAGKTPIKQQHRKIELKPHAQGPEHRAEPRLMEDGVEIADMQQKCERRDMKGRSLEARRPRRQITQRQGDRDGGEIGRLQPREALENKSGRVRRTAITSRHIAYGITSPETTKKMVGPDSLARPMT